MNLEPPKSEAITPKKHSFWYKLFAIIASLLLIFLSIQGYLYWVAYMHQ